MTNLEEIVASLTDRLRSLELENQALQQGIRPKIYVNPKPHPTTERYAYDLSSWSAFKGKDEATLVNQQEQSPRPRSGLSDKETSPAPFMLPSSANCISTGTMPPFDHNSIVEQQYNPRNSDETPQLNLLSNTLSSTSSNNVDNSIIINTATFCSQPLQLPSEPRRTYDMDSICSSWPLTTTERQQRFSQGLCLVCGSQDTSKQLVLGPTLALGLSDKSSH
ncbi:hypothetical protein BASA82_001106 [Batrachochytrium salamandrivorans]|nr:hypothetical protein BASA82_001106 [Batrachochytrium salamandrivorans]